MDYIFEDELLAVAVVGAIRAGDVPELKRLLEENPNLATVRIAERNNKAECSSNDVARSLLHIATDWPGHYPNVAATVAVLVTTGAEVNAQFVGSHAETPLHWAASNDDIAALDALLDAGANMEAAGAIIAGGTPLDDAVAFAQWRTAQRLVERGAKFALWHAAALGMMSAMESHFSGDTLSSRYPWGEGGSSLPDEVSVAFWCACHGGQRHAAEYLLQQGAELNWISVWDGSTPVDAAKNSGANELVQWLLELGGKLTSE